MSRAGRFLPAALAAGIAGWVFPGPAGAALEGQMFRVTAPTLTVPVDTSMSTQAISFRFISPASKTLASVVVKISSKTGNPTPQIGIRSNSGAGFPTDTFLSSTSFPVGGGMQWRRIDIPDIALTAGTTYHLVFSSNTAAVLGDKYEIGVTSPAENFFPKNSTVAASLAVLEMTTGAWVVSPYKTPVMILEWTDGTFDGQVYDSCGTFVLFGSSNTQAAEFFTVADTKTIDRVEVFVKGFAAISPLDYRLDNLTDATLVKAGQFSPPGGADPVWISTPISPAVSLVPGKRYRFRVWSMDTSGYAWLGALTTSAPWNLATWGSTESYAEKSADAFLTSTVFLDMDMAFRFNVVPLPLAPSGFAGTALTTTSISWNWLDNAANEDGYRLMSATSPTNISGDLAANTTFFIESGLTANTSYARLVRAFNIAGSADSASLTKFTLAAPPAGTVITAVSSSSVTLDWLPNGNPEPGTDYEVWRATEPGFNPSVATLVSTTNFQATGLSPSTTYYFKVRARNGDLVFSGFDVTVSTKTAAAPLPPAVSFLAPVNGQILKALPAISGNASDEVGVSTVAVRIFDQSANATWNGAAWITGDIVDWRATTGTAYPANWEYPKTPDTSPAWISGNTYRLSARVTDVDGLVTIATITFTFDNTPPTAITGLTARTGASAGSVDVSWVAPSDALSGVSSYDLRYATYLFTAFTDPNVTAVTGEPAPAAPGTVQAMTVGSLQQGVTYFFRIAAADGVGNVSALSSTAAAVARLATAPPDSIAGKVTLPDGVTGVNAVEAQAIAPDGSLAARAFTDSAGVYTLKGLTAGTTYSVKVIWSLNDVVSSAFKTGFPPGTGEVNFTLSVAVTLGSISGVVSLGARPQPIGPAGAPAFAPGFQPYVELHQRGLVVAKAAVGVDGRFSVSNLLPGTYQVRAFNGAQYSNFQTVKLSEGQAYTLNFEYPLEITREETYNYPNPILHPKKSTIFRYRTPNANHDAAVRIYTLNGELVKEIKNGDFAPRPGGVYEAAWNLTNESGNEIASGVYLWILEVKEKSSGETVRIRRRLAVER